VNNFGDSKLAPTKPQLASTSGGKEVNGRLKTSALGLMAEKEGTFECTDCGKSLSSARSLMRHGTTCKRAKMNARRIGSDANCNTAGEKSPIAPMAGLPNLRSGAVKMENSSCTFMGMFRSGK